VYFKINGSINTLLLKIKEKPCALFVVNSFLYRKNTILKDNMNPNIKLNMTPYRQLREIVVKKLQKALIREQTIFIKVTIKNKAIISTGVNIVMLIAKEGKPFTDAEFVKKCVLSIAGNICPDIVDKFGEDPLSARTITRRIEDVGDNLLNQLIQKTKTFQFFSLALDESTDIIDCAVNYTYSRN